MSNLTEEYGERGERRRQQLLGAAARTFAERGFHGAKVSEVVRVAGVTQPTFYLYFDSKEAVFAELVETLRRRLRDLVGGDGVTPPGEARALFAYARSTLEAIYTLLAADPDLTWVGLFHAPDADSVREDLSGVLRDLLDEAARQGVLRAGLDLGLTADGLTGTVERLTARWLLTGERTPAELAEATARLALYGVAEGGEAHAQGS